MKRKYPTFDILIKYAILIWLIYLFGGICAHYWLGYGMTTLGQTGDMFGALNTLFTGLTFAGLVFTIYLQRIEINNSKAESKVNQSLRQRQLFEGTFFELNKLLNETILMIKIRITDDKNHCDKAHTIEEVTGRRAIKVLSKRLSDSMVQTCGASLETEINNRYLEIYKILESEISAYFRITYRIFRLIDAAEIDNKMLYAKTIRAQLSNGELIFIFYNCLSDEGKKMKEYIIKYHLLKHLSQSLFPPEEHMNLYPKEAFDDSNDQ